MFDFHLHSNFSADCDTPMEATIEQAIQAGIEELCFTEHIDYEYPDPTISFDLNLPAYNEKLTEMQQKYGGQIRIRKGVELGLQPHQVADYKELMDRETFDFVICSMHTADKKDLHSGDFFAGKTIEEAYEQYYRELLYCVRHFKDYSILGHLDLVKRYTKQQPERQFHDIISEIFQVIIPDGKGIELNTSGYRYGLEGGMPSTGILKLYREHGGEVITVGSDSHVVSTVGYKFRESYELLKSLGFKHVTTFNGMQPEFHVIK